VIADDVSAMRALLRRMLEDTATFEIVGEASDGEEAVEMVGAFQPDLLLLDLSMPLMDGLSAIPDIRRRSPATRIVVLSAMDPGRVREQALASGADAFIEKCLVADSLAQRLVEACQPPLDDEAEVVPSEIAPPEAAAVAEAGGDDDEPGPRPDQEWFHLAFDHAPIGMALVDVDGRFQKVNDAFCRIVARTPADLVGTAVAAISHPGDVDRHAGLGGQLLAGGVPRFQDEHRFIRVDGHIASTVLTWSRLRDGDGSPAGFVCQALDVTDRKQAEITNARAEELRERCEKELARSNAELAQFATIAAHDLKSPLQVISGFAGLLGQTQGGLLDERGQEFLGFILRSATRMNVLIDDLLAYAKVGAERRLHVPVPLDRVVDEVVVSVETELAESGASVEHESLPVVTGDPTLFVQVIQDLVANGLKFVAPGTPPRVRVSASRMVNAWCIDVADNGIGIEVQHRGHIFGMFQRLHRNEYEGTGIGLAICKRIVEQRGGSIWVEENPGGGSRFRFTIPDELGASRLEIPDAAVRNVAARSDPIEDVPLDFSPGPPPAASRSAASGGSAPGRIVDVLLVEDDDDHARLVEEILTGDGPVAEADEADGVDGADRPDTRYRLRRVSDLARARIELERHPTDCILLDLFLPDGQGLDSLSQLTTVDPLVPIVILTSLAEEQLGLQAVHEGAQDYLVKGTVDRPRLSRALRHAIGRKALEARFAEQALHDPLTGLANRTLLLDRIRLELARAGRAGGVALFYLDVDDFKAINDRWGHDAGDEVLVRVARRLARTVRPGDTVGRIGGDEFVVVCGGLESPDALAEMRTRIQQAVARPLLLRDGTELVTASVGMSVGKGVADEPEALIRRADEAMYEAKRGRLKA
jgi:diguanylate cyclase (GGDEF)-like protein/PAS domain S-box-containing protein